MLSTGVFLLFAHFLLQADIVESTLLQDDDLYLRGDKDRPVTRIVRVMKDMLKQLDKEAEEDEETFDKMSCWCETNEKEKTEAVAGGTNRISTLNMDTIDVRQQIVQLENHTYNLEVQIEAAKLVLKNAERTRDAQALEFTFEEKDLIQSIRSLQSTIDQLSDKYVMQAYKKGFLQKSQKGNTSNMAAALQSTMQKHASLLKGVLTHSDRRVLASFLQFATGSSQQESNTTGTTTGNSTGNETEPQTRDNLFQVLQQMKESFESSLTSYRQEEKDNEFAYEKTKTVKENEIELASKRKEVMQTRLADANVRQAENRDQIPLISKALVADERFLNKIKERCSSVSTEFDMRKSTREEEMVAVSEAIAVLNSDDSHQVFSRTFEPTFLQQRMVKSSNSKLRAKASQLLAVVAKKARNPRMAALAVSARLDHFTKVIEGIDTLIGALKQEATVDNMVKAQCSTMMNDNEAATEAKATRKAQVKEVLTRLQQKIKDLADAIANAQKEVAGMQEELRLAGIQRQKEKEEFETTVADQRETQRLLQQAFNILQAFAEKEINVTTFIQTSAHHDRQMPEGFGFETYEKQTTKQEERGGGVLGMLTNIIREAYWMERNTVKDEASAETAYHAFTNETALSIDAKQKEIEDYTGEKGTKEGELVPTEQDMNDVNGELEQLANELAAAHGQCDFIVSNFEVRAKAREEEILGLGQARAILAGAHFAS